MVHIFRLGHVYFVLPLRASHYKFEVLVLPDLARLTQLDLGHPRDTTEFRPWFHGCRGTVRSAYCVLDIVVVVGGRDKMMCVENWNAFFESAQTLPPDGDSAQRLIADRSGCGRSTSNAPLIC